MTNFSIKDLAEFSGIKPHTIRIWEQRYSFLHPQRSQTARRTYTVEELNVLLDVALLNQNGHKISLINKMSLEEKLKVVSEITDRQQKSIHDLIIAMANMNALAFEEALNKSIAQWGLHVTVRQVLLPFSDMIGLLESDSNKSYPENILVVLQCIKQKIYLAIEDYLPVNNGKANILLFQPTGEPEALTLLYLQYMLKMEGYTTLHLGHLSPPHLQLICKHIKPNYVITHLFKKVSAAKKLEDFIFTLKELQQPPLFISIENKPKKNKGLFKSVASMADAMELVKELS